MLKLAHSVKMRILHLKKRILQINDYLQYVLAIQAAANLVA